MIENQCPHVWKYKNDYIPSGGGTIQPIYACTNCSLRLPASEVYQLESLENQNETLRQVKGSQKYIAIVAIIISFLALIIPLLVKGIDKSQCIY